MRVYMRKSLLQIPSPSEEACSVDEEEAFLKDPEQIQDELPQPFRMVSKLINTLIDDAWSTIQNRAQIKLAQQLKKQSPVLESTGQIQISGKTNCLASSDDGEYVFAGVSKGLCVFSALTNLAVSAWEEEDVEVTSLCVTCLGGQVYLIATVDDMGIARLLVYFSNFITLIKVINEPEDVSRRNLCTKFELSRGGDFAGVMLEGNGESWLEVYRFPKDSWLRELELAQTTSQKQQTADSQDGVLTETVPHISSVGDLKLSPSVIIMKIKPPKSISGTSLKSPFEVLQKTEDGNVIGSGQNHMISSLQWEEQEIIFQSVYKKYLDTIESKKTEDKPCEGTFNFLLPGGFLPMFGEMKGSAGVPIAISLWWSGNHDLLKYLLVRPTKDKNDKTEVEPKPDVVWPNARPILCSAVSRCTKYIALGLTEGLLTVWDAYLGLPLSVLSIPGDSDIRHVQFMEPHTVNKDNVTCSTFQVNPKTQVLVSCKDGASHAVVSVRGRDTTVTLKGESEDQSSLPSAIQSIPFQPNLVLFMSRKGTIALMDSTDGTLICNFGLPAPHALATPWDPVFLLDPERQSLFIRGDKKLSPDELLEGKVAASSLFIFNFNQFSFMESYRDTQTRIQAAKHPGTWEERCELYLQDRLQSLGDRNKAMAKCWDQLQQHAALVRQRQEQHLNRTSVTQRSQIQSTRVKQGAKA
ncbi:WD repeat-containing protein 93-like isoform X1 [Acipenser oxyrinchus oxyrinchus]|uniref:WD repeat-containing protein 93-like isoform X1 n=1 Tax=Acipenser oxyrinchus oxyrinchus TaxID=40147 RepID=A0AAD8CUU2_ACIOX|nr:WD repeat-containing protein 93-like isoform X1 [Acipenser oxyrinchus oxyrinchus]